MYVDKKTKMCATCHRNKPKGEYRRNSSKRCGIQSSCCECEDGAKRLQYLNNKDRVKRASKARRNRVRQELELFVRSYFLEHPCADCKETDPLLLDFDHVRGKKIENISAMIIQLRPIGRIQAEIAKCDVRCSNCHRKRTAKQYNWRRGRAIHTEVANLVKAAG